MKKAGSGGQSGHGVRPDWRRKEVNMEDELKMRIQKSAESIEVPEGICPENVEKKLIEASFAKKRSAAERESSRLHVSRMALPGIYGAIAAALLLGCVYAVYQNGLVPKTTENEDVMEETLQPEAPDREEAPDKEKAQFFHSAKLESGDKKQDAGELYQVASSYGEVYDVIWQSLSYWQQDTLSDGGLYVMEEAAELEEATLDAVNGSVPDHSTTNVQVEGVDESDIVKTDGSYIYSVSNNIVHITDIEGGKLSAAGNINLSQSGSVDKILEMYVDDARLVIISSEQESQLKSSEPHHYYMNTSYFTVVYTYDIEDRTKPQLLGKISQEGNYYTSRKIGDTVYLFTNLYMGEYCYDGAEEDAEWVPQINGEPIAADHIYIPRQGAQSLMVSSMDINVPDKTVDEVMILNDSVEVYVSSKSVYLYNRDYYSGMTTTQIARFSLENGYINAAAAGSVGGYVTDTFAVNESGDTFRILTTDNGGNFGNCLYIYDLNLNLKSSLTGIALGEQIYAARYFGDFAYFVTYRNMDPLFAVDLSDEDHPKLLGELKITGYSDYLHIWEDGKLFGIGYETDPDTGWTEGIKIAMFDVSNPVEMKTIDSLVIENASYSPALNAYKTVLVDRTANLIGFITETYKAGKYGGDQIDYLLFDWENGSFHSLLSFPLEEGYQAGNCRGIYVGNYFYIVSPGGTIISFDRKDNYQEVDRISL